MMMTFCKKGVHSLLGLTATATSIDSDCNKIPYKHKEGLGLIITATAETYRPPNVIESSLLKLSSSSSSSPQPPAPSPLPPLLSMFAKKDPGGFGFIDDMGGGVNGLMSCTESLGFESSDERNVEDDHYTRVESPTRAKGRKDAGARRKLKKFPPPLSSFNRNGQPSFFLRSVRTDGRLELSEVRIDRPEILRASRQDGRLRLHLINEEEEEEEEEEGKQKLAQVKEEEEEEEEVEEKEEERIEGWQFKGVSGEVLRRCNEVGIGNNHHHHHHHHHHNLHVWNQHCVSTR